MKQEGHVIEHNVFFSAYLLPMAAYRKNSLQRFCLWQCPEKIVWQAFAAGKTLRKYFLMLLPVTMA